MAVRFTSTYIIQLTASVFLSSSGFAQLQIVFTYNKVTLKSKCSFFIQHLWIRLSIWFLSLGIPLVARVTRRVSLVDHELLTVPEHLSSPPAFSGVRVTRSLVLCVFCRSLFFLLSVFFCAIVLSNLLRFTDSDYTIGIFKLFLMEVITKIESSWVWQGDLPLPIQPTSSIFLSSSGFAQFQIVQKVFLFQA